MRQQSKVPCYCCTLVSTALGSLWPAKMFKVILKSVTTGQAHAARQVESVGLFYTSAATTVALI